MRRLRDQAGTEMHGQREIYRRRMSTNQHVCDGQSLPYGLASGEFVMIGKTVANAYFAQLSDLTMRPRPQKSKLPPPNKK